MTIPPIYVVSKGRWESRLTNKALASMGIDHFVVVEEAEREAYEANLERATVLVLDPAYKNEYDCFDDLGLSKSTGPGPARNFAWDHSISLGAPYHWVMDDNISGFYRLNYNLKTPVSTPAIFEAMQSFVERYSNLEMAGPNYFMFASRKSRMPAYVLNTRIYSCNLIRNDIPYRWRGRYNEDTDLSLRILKGGGCTVQFNAFLQYKMPTQTLKGGNTAEFYENEGTLPKSKMLERMHPDVASVTFRFNRWHHYVDYSPWKGQHLRRKPGVVVPEEPDNFGMVLQQFVNDRWVRIDRPKSEQKKSKYSTGNGNA
jgi:hypothetical protein